MGAHTGESITNFLKYNPSCKIISFEPLKKYCDLIKKKFKNNKNIKIINRLVSSTKANLTVFVPILLNYEYTAASSLSLVYLKRRIKHAFPSIPSSKWKFKKYTATSITIDSLKLQPDLIKVDAEGWEYNVILSAKKTIKSNKPVLFIEYHHHNYQKIKKELNKKNYIPYILNNNTFVKIDNYLEKKIAHEVHLRNIIFFPNKLTSKFQNGGKSSRSSIISKGL